MGEDKNIPPNRASSRRLGDEEILKDRGYTLMPGLLGEGSYAKVKKATEIDPPSRSVAVKIIDKTKASQEFLRKFLDRELEVLKIIKHPNICEMYKIFTSNNKVFIVMEMANHGDLLDYIKLRTRIDEKTAQKFFLQITDAVKYLHDTGICHRDLKCENILLYGATGAENNVKITDFGFGRRFRKNEGSKTFCGSAAYAAPEVLSGKEYNPIYYDIWSCGIVLYIMVNGSMPFDDSNPHEMVRCQTEKPLHFSRRARISDDVKALILKILKPIPDQRLPIRDMQNDIWCKDMKIQLDNEQNIRKGIK